MDPQSALGSALFPFAVPAVERNPSMLPRVEVLLRLPEFQHLLVAGMVPVADEVHCQSRELARHADFFEGKMERIGIVIGTDATPVVQQWIKVGRSWGLEERCKETAVRRQSFPNPGQVVHDRVEGNVSEHG